MSFHDAHLAELGHLNYLEFARESTRWCGAGGRIEERDGVLLFAQATEFPVLCNGAHRLDPELAGADAVAIADEWFSSLGRGYTLAVRRGESHDDDDLALAAAAAGLVEIFEAPEMVCRQRLDDRPVPAGAELRWVVDDEGMRDFAEVNSEAYTSLEVPEGLAAEVIVDAGRFTAPHVQSVVAYLDGTPVAAAQTILSHGIAGVYWVGTVERARGTGLGEAVTRAVTNRAFDLGAALNSLQASPMGEAIYRRMGYEEIYRYVNYTRFEPLGR
jgi:GNAT superfamily N-acetyltransferase